MGAYKLFLPFSICIFSKDILGVVFYPLSFFFFFFLFLSLTSFSFCHGFVQRKTLNQRTTTNSSGTVEAYAVSGSKSALAYPRTMTPGPSFDYGRLRLEAHIRWLKPSEILFILQNHENFPIEKQTPVKPLSGSLFLFNRRILRFFRKDGHTWRKKKDGRSVGEAHERLKVGNADALNCYYAHGENNPYFQRRSYWMLEQDYDHIVLVHYREVSEGRFLPPILSKPQEQIPSQIDNPIANDDHLQRHPSISSEIYDSCQVSRSSVSGEVNSKYIGEVFDTNYLNVNNSSENSDPSSQPEVNQALRELEEQLSLDKSDNNVLEDLVPAHTNECEILENPVLLNIEEDASSQKFQENIVPGMKCSAYDRGPIGKHKSPSLLLPGIFRRNSPWNDMLELVSSSTGINAHAFQQFSSEQDDIFGVPFDQLKESRLRQPGHAGENAEQIGGELFTTICPTSVEPNSKVVSVQKEDGFDWMCAINSPVEKTAYLSDLVGMWFDQGQHEMTLATELNLTVPQKPLFKIHEISPEWSFSFERTKVIIIGDFICDPSYAWAVMFGDVEVPAEIVQQGVLRCQTPEHTTEKVTMYITSGTREACSETREFEFRSKPITNSVEALHLVKATKNSDELLLLVKFVNVLLCRHDTSPVSNGAGQKEAEFHIKSKAGEDQCIQIIDRLQAGCEDSSFALDWVLQELLKDKFQQWLSSKINAKEDSSCLLSKEEQGIIHKISGLGYEWALNPTVHAGVGINFRDANGWTALHWAAHFGREKMAAALLASGALAGAVTDPTPHDPVGKTAGAIAAASGHKGLAGYLSEADLTSHLSSLNMVECEISKISATVVAEKAVESISERTAQLCGGTEDELSLKDSLAAVRNAAQAAARIQAAFRAHSFRKKQEKSLTDYDEYGMTSKELHGLISSSKNQRATRSYRDQKFDKAALSIQKKYRGWKGRKDFLTLRHHILKIQAHVRGHQVRKKYKEFLWTVGVFEKVVLRWRRKGVGLRGFRLETNIVEEGEGEEDKEDILKAFRKQKVDEALDLAFSRVLSMVESPRARQQYRRMLESFREAKASECSFEEAISWLQENLDRMQDVEFPYWLS